MKRTQSIRKRYYYATCIFRCVSDALVLNPVVITPIVYQPIAFTFCSTTGQPTKEFLEESARELPTGATPDSFQLLSMTILEITRVHYEQVCAQINKTAQKLGDNIVLLSKKQSIRKRYYYVTCSFASNGDGIVVNPVVVMPVVFGHISFTFWTTEQTLTREELEKAARTFLLDPPVSCQLIWMTLLEISPAQYNQLGAQLAKEKEQRIGENIVVYSK